jgi:phosphoribosylglycinamide formyltransferase 1
MNRIAIFASGTGSNAQKIIDYFRLSSNISVSLIVCNKPDAGVIKIAQKENVPTLIIKNPDFRTTGYIEELKKRQIDFIVLAGFLWKIPSILIHEFPDRIINIHPALLPAYGGKGMYGNAIHLAVISAKEKESGITIHLVDEHYDHGKILFQKTCIVNPYETEESLADKIHKLEHLYYAPQIENWILATNINPLKA